jgi:dUTP pyrophosphatase
MSNRIEYQAEYELVRGTKESAGFDLRYKGEKMELLPNDRALMSTSLRVKMPSGFYGMVCSRSGLAHNYGVFVLNAPGIIDSDYRGEVRVILLNSGDGPYTISPDDKIAQIIFSELPSKSYQNFHRVDGIDFDTERGENGFGSTGV